MDKKHKMKESKKKKKKDRIFLKKIIERVNHFNICRETIFLTCHMS